MAIQLIFCVETNKKADTDSIYISELVNYFYELNNQIKINKVYMGTKSKYNSKEVLKEIEKKTKAFVLGETKVIYCIDTDEYEKCIEHQTELNIIKQYCKENGYDMIWFCHDVEEVFLNKKISDSQKVQEAGAFRRKKGIQEIRLDYLTSSVMRVHTSNIMQVLDKYLARKKI